MDNEEIFKYIYPFECDVLSLIKGKDLQEILTLTNEYYLELRDDLEFDDNITFGLEIEYENAKKRKIIEKLPSCFDENNWKIVKDGSLVHGDEINSPILKNSQKVWHDLKEICDCLNKYASIDLKAGGHIHIGSQILGNDIKYWLNFIKLWSIYENVIFRFSYGEYLNARPFLDQYAKPISNYFKNNYQIFKHFNDSFLLIRNINIDRDREYAVNLHNIWQSCNHVYKGNTIEFRCPNGTLNPIIWQNNVNLFIHLLIYCKSDKFNDELVEKRFKENIHNDNYLDLYDEIKIEQTLEFCDLIFDKNIDKVYFLRQYLKSFEINNKYIKAKAFTKK